MRSAGAADRDQLTGDARVPPRMAARDRCQVLSLII